MLQGGEMWQDSNLRCLPGIGHFWFHNYKAL